MSNTENMVLSILKNIQADMSILKKGVHELKEMKEQMDAVTMYVTYTIGLHTENTVKIENIEKNRLDKIEKRLETLEARS